MPSNDPAAAAAQRAAALQDRTRRWIAALEVERNGYVVRGLDDRVALVDAELAKARDALAGAPAPVSEPPAAPAARRRRGPAKAALEGDQD